MRSKRYAALVLGLTLLIVAMPAFSRGTEEADEEGGTQAAAVPMTGPSWTADTSPITLDAWVNFNPNPWDGWGTDPVSQEITERTGVTLNIELASAPDNAEIMGMLAANELPDFVIAGGGSLRPTLWQQEFVHSLYELMDEYAPTMRAIIPEDMDIIWQEENGEWYFIPGYYSDVDRVLDLPGIQATISGLTVHLPTYEAMGRPPMTTLEEYRDVLLQVKDEYPDMPFYVYDDFADAPSDDQRNMAQMINRIFGGGNLKRIRDDGSVYLNFQDEEYLNALRYISSLHQDGLLNPEIFTTQTQELNAEIFQNERAFSVWGQPFNIYKFDMTDEGPYGAVEPPKEPGIPLYWRAAATQIGGWPLAAISTNTEHPDRAIRYFEFLLSDEGQLLTYHGIEGVHYTWEDGMPKNMPEKAELWKKNFSEVQSTMGIINYRVTWFPTNWADMLYYYWLNEENPKYLEDSIINNQYARNERIHELIRVPSDSDEAAIERKIIELWTATLPDLYLAESEGDLVAAHEEFVNQAERLGLAQLEQRYSREYARWAELLDIE